jgi:hypothetical protein
MTGNIPKPSPWLHGPLTDSLLITGPAFFALMVALWFQARFPNLNETPPLMWLLLVVGIDVAHVYSTLFKTYFNRREFTARRPLFLTIPVAVLTAGVMAYSVSPKLFWSLLAYTAVFHFVRQQYGFLRIYSRSEPGISRTGRIIDTVTIYSATLLPVIWWHLSPDRVFSWLIKDDFLHFASPALAGLVKILFFLTLAVWSGKEVLQACRTRTLNLPRCLIVTGTAASWYTGIVLFNSDVIFTITNVVAHGIPYIALVWLTERKTARKTSPVPERTWTIPLALMLPLILAFAWIEEGLWDGLLFRDHETWFPGFSALPQISDSTWLTLLIPLLALPQATHYVIDGFIWRSKDRTRDA